MSLHKHRPERADSLAKDPGKEYAEFKTVYGSTKPGTLKKRSGARDVLAVPIADENPNATPTVQTDSLFAIFSSCLSCRRKDQ